MADIREIESAWNGFESQVLDPAAPAVQRSEMRRAFYGGAWAVLTTCFNLASDRTEDGVVRLEAMRRECIEFKNRIAAGQA
jgi:hypothetical protein